MTTCDADHDLLFVYGTLRPGSGHPMGAWLAAHAEWRGAAWCEAARLYRVSWYPALAPGAPGERVRGDLYRLRDPRRLWLELDAFEGVAGTPDDEYARRRGPVRTAEGAELRAWAYWWRGDCEGLQCVPGGDWLAEGGDE